MRYIISIFLVLILLALNVFCGTVHIAPTEVMQAFVGSMEDSPVAFIVIENRLPQALTALFAGAALSVSGLLLQTAFRNPLAGPSVLGISNGASLGVALVTLVSGGMLFGVAEYIATIAAALVGALAVTLLLYVVSNTINNRYSLLIAGIMISYLITSVISLLTFQSTEHNLQRYVMWGMGNFSMVSLRELPYFGVAVSIVLLMCMPLIKPLNIMLLGEGYAESMGVKVKTLRNRLLLVTGILSAVVTACCGPIAFIGLAVPHIVRGITKTDDFRTLLPMTILWGAVVALACSFICTLPSDTVIPLAAVTPLVGAPVVLWKIMRV